MKFALIRLYTLTYARGKLGIGCIRFKHAGIRWHTLGPKYIFQHVENVGRMSPCGLYAKYTLDLR